MSSRNNNDQITAALEYAAGSVTALIKSHHPDPARVLIDGRSGVGKTTFARMLLDRCRPAQLISLDEMYPGWGGLAAGAQHMQRHVLSPLRQCRQARYQRWDWVNNSGAEWVSVDATVPTIIEGCGAITNSSAALADIRIWLATADETERKARALSRDGEGYEPFWEMWAQQEDMHIRQHQPQQLADLVIDVP